MKIISHRGNGNQYKENTKKAIIEALKYDYIDGVEFDIRMTKDHKFVLSHEPFYNGKVIAFTKFKYLKAEELNDLLSNIKTDKIIMIDIKEELKREKKLIFYLKKILKKYDLNFYICSFNYNLISLIGNSYKRGLIISSRLNENKIKNDFNFNSINYKMIDKKTSKETFAWTVNKRVKMPCHIITDKPSLFCDFFF